MAQKVTVSITSDLSGEAGAETVAFAWKGSAYEIDLTAKEVEKIEKALQAVIDASRKIGKTGSAKPSGSRSARRSQSDYDPAAVRAWATANGVTVSPRGRISAEVVEKYKTFNA